MKNNDLMSLFSFILKHQNIIVYNNEIFSKDTLVMLRGIIKGKIPNNFKLTKEQEDMLIKAFLNGNNPFDQETPGFITTNPECIYHALGVDINSANFINDISPDLQLYIIDKALINNFILESYSPSYLKDNYQIALNSIQANPRTADFVNWDHLSQEHVEQLINHAIKHGYFLSSSSPEILATNLDIVLSSIKKYAFTYVHARGNAAHHPDVFEHLILHEYKYNNGYLKSRALSYISNPEILKQCLKNLNYYTFNSKNKKYISQMAQLYFDAINIYPTVKTFDSVLETIAEDKWIKHRQNNKDVYDNIFGKICTELRHASSFDEAIYNLDFMYEMETILTGMFNKLYKAMNEYFNLYHSITPPDLEKLGKAQDIIATLSALFVAKSKEMIKKKTMQANYKRLKPFFTLKLQNAYINKKVIQHQKKTQFAKLYEFKDLKIMEFINDIVENYSQHIDRELVIQMIDTFIKNGNKQIYQIVPKPYHYFEYERYEKACKLINRLNRGYIRYDGLETFYYRDIIAYDDKKQQYIYTGVTFTNDVIPSYKKYKYKEQIYRNIKKDISRKIQTMNFDITIDNKTLATLTEQLPFNDEYFEFNHQYALEQFTMDDFCKTINPFSCPTAFTLDEVYQNTYNMLVNHGIIWLLLFFSKNNPNSDLAEINFKAENIFEIVDNMPYITSLANDLKFDITEFKDLLLIHNIGKWADRQTIEILGKETIYKLSKCQTYTKKNTQSILNIAKELVCKMVKKSTSTVPYINGDILNYHYSLYDSQDETILLAGINTDSCFKIDSIGNNFLLYCALNPNGFIIKITDNNGNFVARSSGFRNGNCIFINQLKTIYDQGGNEYSGALENEQKDIIATFKKACQDIVDTSQANTEEVDKIEFVFVTQSYLLKEYESNVQYNVKQKIGNFPINTTSENWKKFVTEISKIKKEQDGCFETDYGNYALICIAAAKDIDNITPQNIKKYDVPAIYERKRNNIIVSDKRDINVYHKINKIKAIHSFFQKNKFIPENIPEHSICFVGDNWYIIYNNKSIISSCLLSFDQKAKTEFDATKQTIIKYSMANPEQLPDYNQLSSLLQEQNLKDDTKILKFPPKH